MSICYSEAKSDLSGPPKLQYANSAWRKHLENWYFLKWIAEHDPSYAQRHQANKELLIAERKMAYWERFRGYFDPERAVRDRDEVKRQWSGKRRAQ